MDHHYFYLFATVAISLGLGVALDRLYLHFTRKLVISSRKEDQPIA